MQNKANILLYQLGVNWNVTKLIAKLSQKSLSQKLQNDAKPIL